MVKLDNTVTSTNSASDFLISFPQYKHGGPIIAVQVENEYGSYNKDPAYMPYIRNVRVSSVHFFIFLPWGYIMGSGVARQSNTSLMSIPHLPVPFTSESFLHIFISTGLSLIYPLSI